MEVKTDIFTGQMGIQPTSREIKVTPAGYRDGSCSIEVLSLFSTTLCSLMGLRIGVTDPDLQVSVAFVDETQPQKSKILLVDVDNDEYYHPISTDLTETLIPDRPRRGLVAFPTIRHSTSRLELHMTGLGAGLQDFSERVCFAIETPDLADIDPESKRGQSPETIKQVLYDALDAQRDRLRGVIEQEVESASGCAVAGLLLLGPALTAVLLL